ncbi:methyl-accepting chemotaxis protein [Desulfobotulus sp. H1]|uniref:Methyl-accepting chemotaxis protein n=1 Tax=Desulfobotulus pelophilus TaxID=2823377 RepID=A0ABT3NCP9_9BACT|nr:methyl-accepting chemotaxis protein [Desulfobotulus pelophilus]MCW7755227.1 methyl-accepting chemotaxis protein [Desulfobotulus pelophilus]
MLLNRRKKRGLPETFFAEIASDPRAPLDLSHRFMKTDIRASHRPVMEMLDRIYDRFESQMHSIAEGALPLSSLAPELADIADRFQDTGTKQQELAIRMVEETEQAVRAEASMADLACRAAEHSEAIAHALEICKNQGHTAGKGMGHIGEETRMLSEQVGQLSSDAMRIDQIIGTIAAIAEDTGLLSLNASIEAARSGRAGAGFAVIAQEIRRLSSQVAQAADSIHTELSRIRGQIRETAAGVDRVKNCVEEGEIAITDVLSGLGEVGVRHGTFVQDMGVLSRTAEGQVRVFGDVASFVREIRQGIEERNGEGVKILSCARNIRNLTEKQLVATGGFHLRCHSRAKAAVSALAASGELLSDQRPVREGILAEFVSSAAYVELVYLTDTRGVQTVANQFRRGMDAVYASDGYGADWSGRPWFEKVKKSQKVFASDIYRSKATDAFCCTVAVPVHDSEGRFSGVLAADLCLEELLKIS